MHRLEAIDPAQYALPEDLTDRLVSPALVVYLDRVRDNLNRVIAELRGDVDRWRPHVKTVKIPTVFAEMVRAGVRGFKCATTREAEQLGQALHDAGLIGGDVLVAHPVTGPGLEQLGQLASRRHETRFSVLCEDPDVAEAVPSALDLFVDVNPGMNRTGVPVEQRGRVLEIARRAAARFRGLHYYDGHLHQADATERRQAVFACYDQLFDLVTYLRGKRLRVGEVVTSGTPSFPDAVDYGRFLELQETAHRLSPGTVVYHDARSAELNPALDLMPAALVFTRVVSHPGQDLVTCDAGSKSVAAEAGDPCAFALGHPELVALTPSEEHLSFRVRSSNLPPRGTELLLVPRHVCPTVNLAESAILIEDCGVREVAPVSARAHDLLID